MCKIQDKGVGGGVSAGLVGSDRRDFEHFVFYFLYRRFFSFTCKPDEHSALDVDHDDPGSRYDSHTCL